MNGSNATDPSPSDTPTVQYDERMGTYHAQYDWSSDEPLRMFVTEFVAEVADVEPTDLDSLYDSVNPTALDEIFETKVNGTPRTGGGIWFTVDEYKVTVHADGEVVVSPLRDE